MNHAIGVWPKNKLQQGVEVEGTFVAFAKSEDNRKLENNS